MIGIHFRSTQKNIHHYNQQNLNSLLKAEALNLLFNIQNIKALLLQSSEAFKTSHLYALLQKQKNNLSERFLKDLVNAEIMSIYLFLDLFDKKGLFQSK